MSINSPRDIEKIFKYIENVKTCLQCGKIFKYDQHNQHKKICYECYSKQRNGVNRGLNHRHLSISNIMKTD